MTQTENVFVFLRHFMIISCLYKCLALTGKKQGVVSRYKSIIQVQHVWPDDDCEDRKLNQTTLRQLQKTIGHLLPNGNPSLQLAATTIGTSTRTLQRHLAKADLSYSTLVDVVRFNKACKMLKSDKYKISEIASRLGYADAGSFTRAFIRWSGYTPQEFRKSSQQAVA